MLSLWLGGGNDEAMAMFTVDVDIYGNEVLS